MINPSFPNDEWITDQEAGCGSEPPVWDIENRAKDRDDEATDAMRVHNGMTLDEFLARPDATQ